MLVVRADQMKVFELEAGARFERKMVDLLLSHYPRECRQAGGHDQVAAAVHMGIQAGRLGGYTTEGQLSKYLLLTAILGVDFFRDPQLPWVADCLDETAMPDPTVRIDNLFADTLYFLGVTAGKKAELVVRAMLRIRDFDLAGVPQSEGDVWIADICEVLGRLYPERYAFQGEEATALMIRDAIAKADGYGIRDKAGVFVCIKHMFMLGSGFDHDPFHPWAGAILRDDSIASESERIARLYQAEIDHIAQSLSS